MQCQIAGGLKLKIKRVLLVLALLAALTAADAAAKSYRKAAEAMGCTYVGGKRICSSAEMVDKSVAQGNEEAKAALYALLENADADEQYNIDRKYYYGDGMNKDYESAVKWFCRDAVFSHYGRSDNRKRAWPHCGNSTLPPE